MNKSVKTNLFMQLNGYGFWNHSEWLLEWKRHLVCWIHATRDHLENNAKQKKRHADSWNCSLPWQPLSSQCYCNPTAPPDIVMGHFDYPLNILNLAPGTELWKRLAEQPFQTNSWSFKICFSSLQYFMKKALESLSTGGTNT